MTKGNDKISIVVPVYKVEQYLEKCIETLVNQTYTNLEIILVDDGSPDACGRMCDDFAARDDRIKVIHKENGGLSSARNAGIKIATGKYIGFVDSDDYIHPRMFEVLYEGLCRNNAEISICGHYTEKDDRLIIEEPPMDEEKLLRPDEAQQMLIEDVYFKNYAWDKLYLRSLFEGVEYPEGRNYEDIAVTYLLFDKAKAIAIIPEYMYYYQIRSNSISNNSSDEKWRVNCRDMVISMQERYEYYVKKQKPKLAELSLAALVPYIITFLNLDIRLKKREGCTQFKGFLREHRAEIAGNSLLSGKDKKLVDIYTSPDILCNAYVWYAGRKRKSSSLKRNLGKVLERLKSKKVGDYSLREGKTTRVFLFELPCFDNLGDHAIAYATKAFFENLAEKHPEMQLCTVKGWDTPAAVRQIKKELRKNDVFICQGGGNMGNLYGFGEAFRRTIMKAFSENVIIVFPQTIYFTDDENGRQELDKSREIYNACKNLTLLARDGVSLERMKQAFRVNVLPMVDVVTYLDKSAFAKEDREGVVLCLRSDVESGLLATEKKALQDICDSRFEKTVITDTVGKIDVSEEERERFLEKKWKLFAGAKLVITDRLHGMIFSLITATPCIVLGNNHHKVRETFKTLQKCEYIWYADSFEQVPGLIGEAETYVKASKPQKTVLAEEFEELAAFIEKQLYEDR